MSDNILARTDELVNFDETPKEEPSIIFRRGGKTTRIFRIKADEGGKLPDRPILYRCGSVEKYLEIEL